MHFRCSSANSTWTFVWTQTINRITPLFKRGPKKKRLQGVVKAVSMKKPADIFIGWNIRENQNKVEGSRLNAWRNAQTRFKSRDTHFRSKTEQFRHEKPICVAHLTSNILSLGSCARSISWWNINSISWWRGYRSFRHTSSKIHTKFRRRQHDTYSDYGIDFSTMNLRARRDYFRIDFLDKNTDFTSSNVCRCAAGTATHLLNMKLKYFQPVANLPNKWTPLLQLDQHV